MITIKGLLKEAVERNASDIHVAAGIPPKLRINGELEDMGTVKLSQAEVDELLFMILPDYKWKNLENKGEAECAYSIQGIGRCRVDAFKQRGEYAFVMRIISTKIPSAKELGIPDSVVELVCQKRRGLVLAAGPVGSGRTTTLASFIDRINTNCCCHIITLENPIEYLHHHKKSIVSQRETGLDTKDYPQAIQAALREDPDVLLIGEINDFNTASKAIAAAEAGCRVFSTFPAAGAANTIGRIIGLFPLQLQQQAGIRLASVLEAVISQQLIPAQDSQERAAVFEVALATAAVKNLIREAKTHQIDSVIQAGQKAGMQTMDDAIYEMYLKRKIDAERAVSFSQDPSAMERRLY